MCWILQAFFCWFVFVTKFGLLMSLAQSVVKTHLVFSHPKGQRVWFGHSLEKPTRLKMLWPLSKRREKNLKVSFLGFTNAWGRENGGSFMYGQTAGQEKWEGGGVHRYILKFCRGYDQKEVVLRGVDLICSIDSVIVLLHFQYLMYWFHSPYNSQVMWKEHKYF